MDTYIPTALNVQILGVNVDDCELDTEKMYPEPASTPAFVQFNPPQSSHLSSPRIAATPPNPNLPWNIWLQPF
jgi:hypothetical protein